MNKTLFIIKQALFILVDQKDLKHEDVSLITNVIDDLVYDKKITKHTLNKIEESYKQKL